MENNKKTSPIEEEVTTNDYDKVIEKVVSIFDNRNLNFSISVLDEVKKRLSKKSVVKLNVS